MGRRGGAGEYVNERCLMDDLRTFSVHQGERHYSLRSREIQCCARDAISRPKRDRKDEGQRSPPWISRSAANSYLLVEGEGEVGCC